MEKCQQFGQLVEQRLQEFDSNTIEIPVKELESFFGYDASTYKRGVTIPHVIPMQLLEINCILGKVQRRRVAYASIISEG